MIRGKLLGATSQMGQPSDRRRSEGNAINHPPARRNHPKVPTTPSRTLPPLRDPEVVAQWPSWRPTMDMVHPNLHTDTGHSCADKLACAALSSASFQWNHSRTNQFSDCSSVRPLVRTSCPFSSTNKHLFEIPSIPSNNKLFVGDVCFFATIYSL